tara:strand:+ start:3507 stop:3689 length:183 start_codon:yes stop_codon:yes gene_type:complete
MTDAVQRAMKADYVKILGENKKMKQKIANLEKELAVLKAAIPEAPEFDMSSIKIGGTTDE